MVLEVLAEHARQLLTETMLTDRWLCLVARLQRWRTVGEGTKYLKIVGMEGAFVGDDRTHDHQVQNKILNIGVQSIKEAGYNAQGVALTGDPAIEIANYAMQQHCDLIIVAHKHTTIWAARWWGSFKSKALIEIAHCSILIVILNESVTDS